MTTIPRHAMIIAIIRAHVVPQKSPKAMTINRIPSTMCTHSPTTRVEFVHVIWPDDEQLVVDHRRHTREKS